MAKCNCGAELDEYGDCVNGCDDDDDYLDDDDDYDDDDDD